MLDAQEGTRKSTDGLAQKMKDEGGEEPTPGQNSVSGASGSMGKASQGLGQSRSRQASGDQQEAIDQLDQAQQKVQDALDQLKRELQEELLAALEERFLEMLEKQRGITKETAAVDAALAGMAGPDRAQKQKLSELSTGEGDLAGKSDEALELLREEGSTVVFPEIIQGMKKDLVGIGGWLASTKTDAFVQSVQKDVEKTLEDLIEAVRKRQEHRSGGT